MKIVAIIQARMGSSRLPGKTLAKISGRSMLALVCHRLGQAALLDELVVATSLQPADGKIMAECRRLRVACFRGSEHDVLDRYHEAAERHAADVVLRITADCPLIDPQVVDRVVAAFLAERPDYASNTLQRSWPRGLDAEVIGAAALAWAAREATAAHERVHVTPYIYRRPDSFRLVSVTGLEDHSHQRWTVDWPQDLEFVRAVYRRLGTEGTFSWRDVEALLAREPALAELNRHVAQKELVEG